MSDNQSYWEVIKKRRSIRKFTDREVSNSIIQKAIEAAVIAPNSSNTQTWNFYCIASSDYKKQATEFCFNQSAARTANKLIAVVADPILWKRSQKRLIEYADSVNAPSVVKTYYKKLIPYVYTWGFLNSLAPIKFIISSVIGLFKPIMRGPFTKADVQEVAIKSAALAAENFVLAITAQGFATCMMEGFDEYKMKKLLKLSGSARIVMMIAVGEEGERGTWGPQYRIPTEEVVKYI